MEVEKERKRKNRNKNRNKEKRKKDSGKKRRSIGLWQCDTRAKRCGL